MVTWDGASATELAKTLDIARLELRDEVESTQDIAHALAEQGAPHGTLVLADAQRAGRGRMGRTWSSEPGAGVWCTFVARPTDLRALDVLSIRLGLSIGEALDALTAPRRIQLKWPNDLLLGDGKLGGILTEARWSGTTLSWVAIGMGINVRPPDVPLGAGLGDGVQRRDVLGAVVDAAAQATSAKGWLTADERTRYRSRDALLGRRITEPGRGVVAGIAESGALRVETGQGVTEYRAGTIKYAEDA
ncbi:MAG TPA: biotin--[acetyl-CoA-carboxylase] ligase [Gemmatimonadaceae bacterium]|nr:biotin--[acetyl-CoA-carboxylase] ligase [Gemmatimonadaceae bacterium]